MKYDLAFDIGLEIIRKSLVDIDKSCVPYALPDPLTIHTGVFLHLLTTTTLIHPHRAPNTHTTPVPRSIRFDYQYSIIRTKEHKEQEQKAGERRIFQSLSLFLFFFSSLLETIIIDYSPSYTGGYLDCLSDKS